MLSISFTQDEIIIIRTLLTKQNKAKQKKRGKIVVCSMIEELAGR